MIRIRSGGLVVMALLLCAGATPAASQAPPAAAAAPIASEAARSPQYERDRQSILAMAGDYKVRFDFRETVSFLPDYKPFPAKVSGGHESVRVVKDDGRGIVLQHLLVVDAGGKPLIVKHWRQDWTYEPASVLTYTGKNRWTLAAVPASERAGAWSQTVWQTDDSPRYGGVGRWSHDGGVARWSNDTLRPLARRDATRNPPYDLYAAMNRHALTPTGWVHEQDNAKLGARDGARQVFVHEVVLNTYDRFKDYPVAAADAYWNETKDYWAEVRTAWDAAIARDGGVYVEEEPENGSVTGPTLMGLADKIAEGEIDQARAVAQARRAIETATRAGATRRAAAR